MRGQIKSLFAVTGLLVSGVFASGATRTIPVPGTLNYVEGQVRVDGKAVDSKSAASEVVQMGGIVSTGNGKAEMLLTPGVFLRLGENSDLRMVSPSLADTEVALLKGTASVEADYLTKDNRLTITGGTASTAVLKKGLYVFHDTQPFVQVLDGKAKVSVDDQHINVGKYEEAVFNSSGKLKSQDFNHKTLENDSLIRWSKLRSGYEAQANLDSAQTVVINNGWYGPGWYWNRGFGFWSFLPGDGILYSPFGWGFYSPAYFYGGPYYYGGGFYRPFYGRPVIGGFRGGFNRGGFARGGGRR